MTLGQGAEEHANVYNCNWGPLYGGGYCNDLAIADKCSQNNNSYADFPWSYNCGSKYQRNQPSVTLFSGATDGYKFGVIEYEVFEVFKWGNDCIHLILRIRHFIQLNNPHYCIWNNLLSRCRRCGTGVSNSVATGGTLMACNCVTGKAWDVMTLACIDICWANNSACMRCLDFPGIRPWGLPMEREVESYIELQ